MASVATAASTVVFFFRLLGRNMRRNSVLLSVNRLFTLVISFPRFRATPTRSFHHHVPIKMPQAPKGNGIPQASHLKDLFSLQGKVVVVTGASGPRGMGIEVRFARALVPALDMIQYQK
jgi:hypothetical protein